MASSRELARQPSRARRSIVRVLTFPRFACVRADCPVRCCRGSRATDPDELLRTTTMEALALMLLPPGAEAPPPPPASPKGVSAPSTPPRHARHRTTPFTPDLVEAQVGPALVGKHGGPADLKAAERVRDFLMLKWGDEAVSALTMLLRNPWFAHHFRPGWQLRSQLSGLRDSLLTKVDAQRPKIMNDRPDDAMVRDALGARLAEYVAPTLHGEQGRLPRWPASLHNAAQEHSLALRAAFPYASYQHDTALHNVSRATGVADPCSCYGLCGPHGCSYDQPALERRYADRVSYEGDAFAAKENANPQSRGVVCRYSRGEHRWI